MVHLFHSYGKKEKSECGNEIKTEDERKKLKAKFGTPQNIPTVIIGASTVDSPLRKRFASESISGSSSTSERHLNRPSTAPNRDGTTKPRQSKPLLMRRKPSLSLINQGLHQPDMKLSNPFSNTQPTTKTPYSASRKNPVDDSIQIQSVAAIRKPRLNVSPVRMHSFKVQCGFQAEEEMVMDPTTARSRSQSPFSGTPPMPTFSQMEALLSMSFPSNRKAITDDGGTTSNEDIFPRNQDTVDYLQVNIPRISITPP